MSKQPVSWEEIREDFENNETSLLLGKGFSCAVWDDFQNSSLYKEASLENNGGASLSAEDQQLFEALGTKNFEKVLATLSTAKIVDEILGAQAHPEILQTIDDRYQNIQRSLIQAVKKVHIPWERITTDVLTTIKEELLKYQNLFYTSYDLLIYWSLMSDGITTGFRDYFNGEKFDENSSKDNNDERLSFFYLHGGLHLYSQGEEIRKITHKPEKNILEQCEELWRNPTIRPLFMAEGTFKDKLKFIRNSDYLLFAYDRFKQNTGKLVILGNPLNLELNQENNHPDFNKHLLDAIVESSPETVAISITADDGDIQRQINNWEDVMNGHDIKFFSAESHPLCSPNIRIEQTDIT